MCLAIPMQVVAIDGSIARCVANGIEREVSLYLLPEEAVAPGDWMIVHVGYAIQKLMSQEAHTTWEMLDEMAGKQRMPERDA